MNKKTKQKRVRHSAAAAAIARDTNREARHSGSTMVREHTIPYHIIRIQYKVAPGTVCDVKATPGRGWVIRVLLFITRDGFLWWSAAI